MGLRRVVPEPLAATTIAEHVAGLDFLALAGAERPYLVTNFVLTLDGRATIRGRSGPIGSDADTELLVGLRTRVDAVMIGAGTMRAERYGPPVKDPAKRERRERAGLAADPLMVLVSASLELPWEAPLFTDGGRVLIWTSSDREPPQTAAPVTVERFEGAVDLRAAVARLRAEHGVRALLCEGGPRLHAELIADGVVDELFVTHAPKLAGGSGPGLVAGLAEKERRLELVSLLHDEGTAELFGRYRLR
ncbi:MAG TPA: dihydrofolate reductase family protein [Solirubrobacterales bacterium]|nr:dihydrofolate reductase family protein [Solirubrobacterales bacterium]